MKKIIFKGCGTAIVTPFNENGVNFEEFGRLIEDQIQNSIDALIVCWTTGEASTKTKEEKEDTIKSAIKKVNKRVPVIVGTGSNCTASAIQMTKFAEEVGADAALIVTPYYNKTTQAGLVAHYEAIAKETNLPIILYSVPGRTGVNILPETCKQLSEIPNIVAIKEASGNISQIAEIASLCGDNMAIYSGNDDQIVPILSLGGLGVISVLSNVAPLYTHNMVQNFFDGKIEESRKMQLESIGLVNALFSEVNPIPAKAALNMMGYDFGQPRLPLIPMSESKKAILKAEMEKMNII